MKEVHEQVGHFLNGLAHALSALGLYARTHPEVDRALGRAHQALADLLAVDPRPVITFLGDEVVVHDRPVKSLRGWEWASRMERAGIQRVEVLDRVPRPDLDAFVELVFARTHAESDAGAAEDSAAEDAGPATIRFGTVSLDQDLDGAAEALAAELGFSLSEEIDAMEWVDHEVRRSGKLHMLEAETIVRSLAVAMHADAEMMIPLVHLKGFDQYTTTHSLNISVLSMAVGEFIGLEGDDVRRLGVAGLLHDIGKTRVPTELLNKDGALTESEMEAIRAHTWEGARILMQREAHLDLAAVVAYEHHIRFDGGGYPQRRFKRPCHPASDLVHLCDVYDALRTHRPYRKAWGQERVLDYIDESLGSEFEPTLGRAFLEMMRRWGSRMYRITAQEEAVPVGELERPGIVADLAALVEDEEPAGASS